jgi:hypothetical protein
LSFEQSQARIPQPLLVLGGSGLGGSYISLRFLDRALGPSATFG